MQRRCPAAHQRQPGSCLPPRASDECPTPHFQTSLCACRLSLQALRFDMPLPDFQPGALPRLRGLHLAAFRPQPLGTAAPALPASWARPGVLPQLSQLTILLPGLAQLPAEWAAGFEQLNVLEVAASMPVQSSIGAVPGGKFVTSCAAGVSSQASGSGSNSGSSTASPADPRSLPVLPPAWAAGFPALKVLHLSCLDVSGPIPSQWCREGSFPQLSQM